MKSDDQEIEEVSQDSLSPYLETEARRQPGAKQNQNGKDRSRDDLDSHPDSKSDPLSDEEVRLAISQPPALAERQRIKNAADVLKRSFPELSALATQDDRERAFELLKDDYFSGQFLLDSLGADRYIEPKIAMTILVLRQEMIQDLQLDGVVEFMLMDGALTAYYNSIKLQRMLGDLAIQVETELFHDDSLSLHVKRDGSLEVNKFKVEEMLNRASGSLMNLVNSCNKMMIRNINALRDLKTRTLSIQTEQINIAHKQVNQVIKGKGNRASLASLQNPPENSATDS